MTTWILEKHVFEKTESRSKDQVTYQEGTLKRYHPLKPLKRSLQARLGEI